MADLRQMLAEANAAVRTAGGMAAWTLSGGPTE